MVTQGSRAFEGLECVALEHDLASSQMSSIVSM